MRMGGFFQETVSKTITSDGVGAGHASIVVNLPFRSGWLNQVTADMNSGDATDFLLNVFEEDNAGTPYTTEANEHKVFTLATGARTEYNLRDAFKFFVAQAKTGNDNIDFRGNMALTIYIAYTGATGASDVKFNFKLGGIGIS